MQLKRIAVIMLGFVPRHQPTMDGRLVVTKEPQHAHHQLIIIAFTQKSDSTAITLLLP